MAKHQMTAILLLLILGAATLLSSAVLVSARTDVASGEEEEGSYVVQLTEENYDDSINITGKITFVKYYAPWCGHCKRLAPTWNKIAEDFKDDLTVDIATVDCTVMKSICKRADIKGYPTLKLYKGGEEIETYKGQRHHSALMKFITDAKN